MTSVVIAAAAGVVSFLSPCVLPLIPGYLMYLAGTSDSSGPRQGRGGRRQYVIFLHSLCFVLGFSLVFALLGVLLNTLLSQVAYDVQIWLSRLGGAIIIIFGLYLIGLIKLSWLSYSHKLTVRSPFASRYLASVVFGAAFAVGWTPCVGAVLGAILGLATTQPGSAFVLLLSYAVGFGVPFLLVGLFTDQAAALIGRYGQWTIWINRVFGLGLILLGLLIFTQTLSRWANFELVQRLLQ